MGAKTATHLLLLAIGDFERSFARSRILKSALEMHSKKR